MPTITVDQAAAILGKSPRYVQELCAQKRIKGARRLGRVWYIPDPVEVIPVRRGRPPKNSSRKPLMSQPENRGGEMGYVYEDGVEVASMADAYRNGLSIYDEQGHRIDVDLLASGIGTGRLRFPDGTEADEGNEEDE